MKTINAQVFIQPDSVTRLDKTNQKFKLEKFGFNDLEPTTKLVAVWVSGQCVTNWSQTLMKWFDEDWSFFPSYLPAVLFKGQQKGQKIEHIFNNDTKIIFNLMSENFVENKKRKRKETFDPCRI